MNAFRSVMLLVAGLFYSVSSLSVSYGSAPALGLRDGDILSSDFHQGIIYRVAGSPGSVPEPFANVAVGITGLAQLPSGDIAVAASTTDRIYRIDAKTGATQGVLFNQGIDNPRNLAVHQSGELWITALSNDQVVAVDHETGAELHRLSVPGAFAIAIRGDRVYVTGQADGSVHMIDAITGAYQGMLVNGLGRNLEAMTINWAGDLLIRDSFDGMLRVDAASGAILARAAAYTPSAGAIDHDGYLIAKNIDGRLVRLDPFSLTEVNTIADSFRPTHGMLVYSIPEPSSVSILGGGIAMAFAWRRFRRRSEAVSS